MKKILLIFTLVFLFTSLCYAGDVSVKGYYRKDGTYVRPHHRSSPDGDVSNNYGRPSYQQRKQYENSPVLPTYQYDYDGDGITNQNDYDDDNDGVSDVYDSNQYGGSGYSQSYTYTTPQTSSYHDYDDSDDYDSGDDYYDYDSGDDYDW